MNNTANKKDIFYIIVLILTFITVVVGATFAIYTFVGGPKNNTDISAVYTGTFSIEYLSGDKINFHYLTPREKPTIDDEENVYKNNFKVTNTGSLNGEATIYIDITKNKFELDDTLKYALYKKKNKEKYEYIEDVNEYSEEIDEDFEEIIEGYIDNNSKEITIASKLEFNSNETEEYTLLIWIEENGKNQSDDMDKELSGKIRVEAMQKKD